MRRVLFLACVVSLVSASIVSAETIEGRYLESRNASVWAGECVVNSETGLAGNQATLAWKVQHGSYENVQLDGLSVVAVVFGDRTFGIGDQVRTRAIVLVDRRASASQQEALVQMAKALAPETIQQVVKVQPTNIVFDIPEQGRSGLCSLDAEIIKLRTRRLYQSDSLCGTDQKRMAYPPLARVSEEQPAFTLESTYTGPEDNVKSFADRNVPSAVLARFAL